MLGKNYALIALALGMALAACGGGESTTSGDGDSTSGSEAAVTSYEGPVGSTDAEAGQQVYATFCQGCHRAGDGGDGAAPATNGIGWTAAHMRQQIREGEDSMPAFAASVLSDEQLEQLLAYLQSTGGVTE